MITKQQRKDFNEDAKFFIYGLQEFYQDLGFELKEINTKNMMTYDKEAKTIIATFYKEVKEQNA